jgi:putative MATE family efflux protein
MYFELKENRPHGTPENPFSQYHISDVKRAFQIPVHWHDELEIIYVKQGKLHVTISGENYIGSPKDAFVVSPGSLHLMGSPTGDADYYTFLFPLEYISFQTDDLMEKSILSPLKRGRLIFNAVIGVLMSVFLAVFSGNILKMVSIAPALFNSANTYLRIVGGACFLNALIPIFSSYLRVFGYTKQSLWASIIGNVINFILNAVFLFVMNWGVMGVATATVISRIINLIIVATMGAVLIKAKDSPERIAPGKILGQIIKIGFPSACETALYNIAMTLVVRFMNQMDADGMNVTARSYATQIANFSYCIGAALAQANAILTGWHIGAKEYDECDRGTRKAAIYGVITASCLSIAFALLGNYIVRIFTNDVQMINLVTKLLAIDIVLELGRVTNLVYGQALKTSGDAVFPVVMGAVFMYLAAVGGTYFFGLHLGLLAVGAYIGLASDECIRAVGMVLRWKSGKWKTKGLVD